MSDFAANETEASPENLAHRQIMIGLGSIHTIKNAITHLMYDLCAHPEYIEEMRDEAEAVLLAGGKWDKPTLTKMRKIESLMTESQRLNPPQLRKFRRISRLLFAIQSDFPRSLTVSFYHRTLKPVTLSDGTHFPAFTQIAVPAAAMLFDPSIVSDPDTFDPLRAYRDRLKPGESNLHQYTMTNTTHMHFGHGKHACPGRAFAVNEVKMITAALLIGFDFCQIKGQSRPRNIIVDEFVYPEPGTNLMIRRRKIREGVPGLGV